MAVRSGNGQVVAKESDSCEAARTRMISTPAGPRRRGATAGFAGARPRVRPLERRVIVLTVKLFGETLEAPRTLAVWQ